MKQYIWAVILLLLMAAVPITGWAAEQPQDANSSIRKIASLESLHKSIQDVSEQVSAVQQELSSPSGVGREETLRAEIARLSQKKADLVKNLEQTVTEVDLKDSKKEESSSLDWNAELTELLGPVISELKKVTSRPRELERLRTRIKRLNEELPKIEKAIKKIDQALAFSKNEALKADLKKMKKSWESRHNEVLTGRNISQRKLDQEMGRKKPLSQSLREIIQLSFKSRGRNVVLSFLAFIVSWFILHGIYRMIQKHSPFHKKERTFTVRLFDLTFIFISVIVSFSAFLAVLYFFGDWVLLSLAIIFVVGLAWASKQAIPMFWIQARLILNFGPVREGEKVIYNGIPFLVSSINLFSQLTNESLTGGLIRLPLRDLMNLRSRSFDQAEPWFPTRQGDWVVLADGTYGKVILQTPDIVKLDVSESGILSMPSSEFVTKSPTNLSNGYELTVTFGMDYRHLTIVTKDVPRVFDEALGLQLAKEGHSEVISSRMVQFKEVGPSSLDLVIKLSIIEGQGGQYRILRRAVERICVDTCNENGWTVPFQQVRVHMTQA